ncbi:hypothetical protein FH972_025053 [Carpinus fangiana]|uniref:Uncharacterized protein n=1 Tax=Carpinus fangiana TaxID=176857 RepID=A0A5N6L2E5_9ROSI|nr:hypothetical protein FH972_025053 [Carpinus fangiana]
MAPLVHHVRRFEDFALKARSRCVAYEPLTDLCIWHERNLWARLGRGTQCIVVVFFALLALFFLDTFYLAKRRNTESDSSTVDRSWTASPIAFINKRRASATDCQKVTKGC